MIYVAEFGLTELGHHCVVAVVVLGLGSKWRLQPAQTACVLRPDRVGAAKRAATAQAEWCGRYSEKCLYVELAIPTMVFPSHQCLQTFDSGLRSFALTVGIAVVNETLIPPRFDLTDKPVVNDTIGKCWRKISRSFGSVTANTVNGCGL